jgi:hypothetical protein
MYIKDVGFSVECEEGEENWEVVRYILLHNERGSL